MSAIAHRFGVTVRAIQDANGIDDPRRLWIGQEIVIPRPSGQAEPTTLPTPTPVALGLRGLGFYRTPTGGLWCLGEVLNLSDEPAEEVQVRVSLHDEQGRLLAAGAAFTQLDIVAGRGRSPFAILYGSPPSSFAQYQTQVLSGVRSTHLGPRYTDLALTDQWAGWSSDGNYRVQGRVQNTGQADALKVAVVIALYDGENHVVGARTVGIEAELFLSGAVAPFDVTLTPLGHVARYSIQVQGWRSGASTPVPAGTAVPTGGATP